MEEFLSPKELARVLKVSVPTIYKWAEKGILPNVKIENTLRFSRGEIWHFLQEHKRGG